MLLGALSLALHMAASPALPPEITAAIIIALLFVLTGALHTDGFMDTVDALAGGSTPEERLKIMRDPAAGAIGSASVAILLLVKYSCILVLIKQNSLAALFLFPAAGRWAMALLASLGSYARENGLGLLFCKNSKANAVIASAMMLIPLIYFFKVKGIVFFIVWIFFVAALAAFFRRKLGGVTGDVFGFVSEITEAAFLVICAAKI